MKITLSVIKAEIGSIGGHIAPSRALLDTVRRHVADRGAHLLLDSYISYNGDDIALLMVRVRGVRDEAVHRLAWDAFVAGTSTAKAQGLYGAGQDLLKDAFSGNVHGMGLVLPWMMTERSSMETSRSSLPTPGLSALTSTSPSGA